MSFKEDRLDELAEERRQKLGAARFWVWSVVAWITMAQFYGTAPWYAVILLGLVTGLLGAFAFVSFTEAVWEVKYHKFEFQQDERMIDEMEGHHRRITSLEQEVKMLRSYIEQTNIVRAERRTVVEHTERARSIALKFLASFYDEDGNPNMKMILPDGQIQVRVPWSKRGTWDDIAPNVSPEESTKARVLLTAEAPGGVVPPFSQGQYSWVLNLDRYPTLKSAEEVFS